MDLRLFPGPGGRGEGVRLLVGHGRQPREDMAQVIEGVDSQTPAVLNDREEDRAALARLGLSDEQPVFLSNGRGSDGVLDEVVVDLHPAVAQEDRKRHAEPHWMRGS